MRIGILTSSRADYGIYIPLLRKLKGDDYFEAYIIAFGTHLSEHHGLTINQIKSDGFEVKYTVPTVFGNDTPKGIATLMGQTSIEFAKFWESEGALFDLIFCIGDRYEMFAAVMAGVHFQIRFAHLHGGERSLGATDNIFRHAITLASKFHFASTYESLERIEELTETKSDIFHVGALSLDNLKDMRLLSLYEFENKWGIDLTQKTILVTFHPETTSLTKNDLYSRELIEAINGLTGFQFLITMPNADTESNVIRNNFLTGFKDKPNVFLVENLGTQSYFSAMNYCTLLLGNTSSGIIEAASFKKYVINLGERQKGRTAGPNVIHTEIESSAIISGVLKIANLMNFEGDNIYFNGGASEKIINILKSIHTDD
jgi:GDP/UDP-N,N'-diacetylbacillosamine 2-epimerase (hydrolysing)